MFSIAFIFIQQKSDEAFKYMEMNDN